MTPNKAAARVLEHPNGQSELSQTYKIILLHFVRFGKLFAKTCAVIQALRELPEINRRELEAVRKVIEETRALPNGKERLEMVRLVFWDKTHTLEGAAMKLHWSARKLVEWHGEFIRYVAKKFGLL